MATLQFKFMVPVIVTVETYVDEEDGNRYLDVSSVNVMDEQAPDAEHWTTIDGAPLDGEDLEIAQLVDDADWPGWEFGW